MQTAAIKAPGQHKPTPAELAAELGLIGGFRSAEGDLAESHSQRMKERLRAKRARESVPISGVIESPSARHKS